ncbi:hypothetical protein LRAMOSA09014 [Lichtheimia ramosa]|uniref:F-box domain-containing protein n=1 Tax=Lichtheimia ramosa TaxID=688394 RepID=A0A077WFW0_9FUNG|nr:hypothetical protein LRAMOSA09014 [Lichtheimia ramosa]
MTNEDNIEGSELLKSTNARAEHANDGNRVMVPPEILQQTACQFVQVLLERAKLLANRAQFEAALREAAAIRVIVPESGLGYLCAGDVYCQQARYAAAITIYGQGLEQVLDSDPYYHQLQQHRMRAINNNNKHVDFISLLPLDIVITNILPRVVPTFSSRSSCELLYVSHAWQDRIIQQSNGLHFDFGSEEDTFKKGQNQLVRFSTHVQKLKGAIKNDVLLDGLFSQGNFVNLKQLDLCCDATTPRRSLTRGLGLIGDSLTHLILLECPCIQLRDILESCPSLQSLSTEKVDVAMPLLSSTRFPKMKHLTLLDIPEAACTHDEMIDVISRFPSLLSFQITPMPESSILTTLHDHCPYLKKLYYGIRRTDCTRSVAEDYHPNHRGIKAARLGGNGSYHTTHLLQFLHLHSRSLALLEFFGKTASNDDAPFVLLDERDLQGVVRFDTSSSQQPEPLFMQLRDVNFLMTNDTMSAVPFIHWITLNAPNMHTIRILESNFQPAITNSMIQLKHLVKLKIDTDSMDDSTNDIARFLQHHIAIQDQSTLGNSGSVHARGGNVRNTLDTFIVAIETSQKTCLFPGYVTNDCESVLEEISQGCPALEDLGLSLRDAQVEQSLIEPLRQHPHLTRLRIRARSLCDDAIIALATFPNLERLELYCNVSDDLLEILQDRIPRSVIRFQS